MFINGVDVVINQLLQWFGGESSVKFLHLFTSM